MIGLIGPTDSVLLAMSVAETMGATQDFVARTYERVEQVADLARELDQLCQVLLFTGELPFMLAQEDEPLQSELHYIPHSGADLYRMISAILIDNLGAMPLVSIDTIDETPVETCFSELYLPVPPRIALISSDERSPETVTRKLVAVHKSQLDDGKAVLALTCLSSVHAELSRDGYAVRRIDHTRTGMRETLDRARLSTQLQKSRAVELAVLLFRLDPQALATGDVYSRESARLSVHLRLLDVARKHGAQLSALDGSAFLLATTRGAIDSAIARQLAGHGSLLDPLEADVEVLAGAGVGDTYAIAEANAKQAMIMGEADTSAGIYVVFSNGRVHSPGRRRASILQFHETGAVLELAETLGLGPLSVRRLFDALYQVDQAAFSAQQLAEAHGIQVRSSRRILTALIRAGFAQEVGIRTRQGAGRPQTLYHVDMKALIDSVGEDLVTSKTATPPGRHAATSLQARPGPQMRNDIDVPVESYVV